MKFRIILFSLLAVSNLITAMDDEHKNLKKDLEVQKKLEYSPEEALAQKLKKYVDDAQAVGTQSMHCLKLYQTFLKKDQVNRQQSVYKKSLEILREIRNSLYESYWADPLARTYIAHPETGDLHDIIKQVRHEAATIERELTEDYKADLQFNDLLLSTPVSSLLDTIRIVIGQKAISQMECEKIKELSKQ